MIWARMLEMEERTAACSVALTIGDGMVGDAAMTTGRRLGDGDERLRVRIRMSGRGAEGKGLSQVLTQ